jgi:hypothetical protein
MFEIKFHLLKDLNYQIQGLHISLALNLQHVTLNRYN